MDILWQLIVVIAAVVCAVASWRWRLVIERASSRSSKRLSSYSVRQLRDALTEIIDGADGLGDMPVIIDDRQIHQLAQRDPHFGSSYCYVTQVVWDERWEAHRLEVR